MADNSLAVCLAEIKANPGRFYVYVLSRPSGEAFYIGCAVASVGRRWHRICDHEMFAKRGEQSLRASIIRKLLSDGYEVAYSIDSWHDDKEAMFAREMELIAGLGRRDLGIGPLANGNDGGTGAVGLSAATVAKMKRINKEMWTPERREAARQRAIVQMADPDRRAKQRDIARKFFADPENKKRFGAQMRELANVPERKAARMAIFSKVLNDPEKQAARNRKRAERMRDAKVRAAISESVKALWDDPEFRERGVKNLAEMNRKAWSNPDSREKHKAAQKARREREKAARQ
ncbi:MULTISPECIES: hypothetical protein [unclassified Mesorhizobium]|uniref:hypothetical protein n=1 Tax=unclassified Mesorhizobium TaxID=325217 RepID=UPI000FDBA079|nr:MULTISPECIES: hypothetical protein [unclassified Mesorhizobium]TGT76717.1 hypothetical protein EN809_003685 [Mesorhizobium sp. M2E.F.Ca.ET.166.01.1.1]TGW02829.1 hypothetical protein EN797_003685 [Mesorhizobium sp. M2E.F.Ca.ET.154.01.1.1]